MVLNAGRDLTITSSMNDGGSKFDSSSGGASVGLKVVVGPNGPAFGVNVAANAAGAEGKEKYTSHNNANIVAGDILSTTSGRDTTVAGAHLEGERVWMDVGGDLTVASLQDHYESKSSNWSAGADVTVGYGVNVGVSLGLGSGKATSDWVDQQTSIIGRKEVDIYTEGNTHIEGAIIATEPGGDLTLNTGTLTYAEIHDKDTSSSSQFGISVSKNFGGSGFEKGKDANPITDEKGNLFKPIDYTSGSGEETTSIPYAPDSVEYQYASHDKRGVLRPTVTEGEIIVRDDPDVDLSGLNRDLDRAREITKDEKTYVDVYVSRDAILEIASGFSGIRNNIETLSEDVMKLVRKYTSTVKSLPPEYKHLGEAGLNAINNMLINGVSQDDINKIMSNQEYNNLIATFSNIEQSLKDYNMLQSIQKDTSYAITDEKTGTITVYIVGPGGDKTIGQYTYEMLGKAYSLIESIPYEGERAAALFGLQVLIGGPIKTAVSMVKDVVVDSVFEETREYIVNNITTFLIDGKSYNEYLDFYSNQKFSFYTQEEIAEGLKDYTPVTEFGLSLIGVVSGVKIKDLAKGLGSNSILSKKAQKQLGRLNTPENLDKTAAQLILERGGNTSNIRQIQTGMAQMKLSEIAELAAQKNPHAITALKLIKQASAKGQKYP